MCVPKKTAALFRDPPRCTCFSNMWSYLESDVMPTCRFFAAEGCKLRVGAYTSLNTLCTYLESDVCADGQAERNFWVSSRFGKLQIRCSPLPS